MLFADSLRPTVEVARAAQNGLLSMTEFSASCCLSGGPTRATT